MVRLRSSPYDAETDFPGILLLGGRPYLHEVSLLVVRMGHPPGRV